LTYVHWVEPPIPAVKRLGYAPALDGLRGVAIALVMLHHADVLPGGYIGVDVFFVLSGFLITTLLLEERAAQGRISLRGFYRRRARRILPALITLLLGYLVVVALAGGSGIRAVALGGFFTGNAVQAFANPNPLAQNGLGLAHLWSLAEEEQFYLLWPVVLILLARTRRLIPALATILAVALVWRGVLAAEGASFYRIYYGPDTHADGLLAGALLAALRWRGSLRPRADPDPVIRLGLRGIDDRTSLRRRLAVHLAVPAPRLRRDDRRGSDRHEDGGAALGPTTRCAGQDQLQPVSLALAGHGRDRVSLPRTARGVCAFAFFAPGVRLLPVRRATVQAGAVAIAPGSALGRLEHAADA
jgi:hypothetical protein